LEFLGEYGLFLAKIVTVIVGILFVVGSVGAAAAKMRKAERRGHIEVEKLNDHYDEMKDTLKEVLLSENDLKEEKKQKKKEKKQELKKKSKTKSSDEDEARKRVFVFDFNGDIRASQNPQLENIISAVVGVAKAGDEVVIRLESPGGMVHSYGLAASQLQRIKNKSIALTICVDKVAASGGYMMACLGDKIIAAPFAMIGSIGVLAQIPNFNRLLKKHDIDYELITAGEYKRTLTMLGENTESGRKKFTEEIQDTHELFKEFVAEARPSLEIEKVATGEVWFGKRALDMDLVDALQTSEEYLLDQSESSDIYKISFVEKRSLQEKVGLAAQESFVRVSDAFLSRDRQFPW